MASETTVDTAAEPDAPAGKPFRRGWLVALCGLAVVIFGSFGIWASVAAHHLRQASAAANVALVSPAQTRAVQQAVTVAVNTIFSYRYTDVGATRRAAQRVLTGAAVRQYDQLFALVEQQAPKEKLVVTTRVSNVGVEFLTGNRARLLVFADQQDSRSGTTQTSYSGAMFAVTTLRRDGHWLITDIDTFSGSS
jgi:Mce-associated membrane protein